MAGLRSCHFSLEKILAFFITPPRNLDKELLQSVNQIKTADKQKLRQGKGKKLSVDSYFTSKKQPT